MVGIFLAQGIEYAFDITKLTVELKGDNVLCRNKIIYITVVVVFRCRQSVVTRSSVVTPYIDLLGVGKTAHFMNEKIAKSLKIVQGHLKLHRLVERV